MIGNMGYRSQGNAHFNRGPGNGENNNDGGLRQSNGSAMDGAQD